jgi:putative peptide zinc metalloprotease protein
MAQSEVLDCPSTSAGPPPRLAPGTELLGEYQDSAYQDPKFLVRRADGQVMQLPHLLYRLAGSLDGRDPEQIAADLSAELSRDLTAEQVTFLVEDRLRPVGIIAPDDTDPHDADGEGGTGRVLLRSDPLLGLRYRTGVISADVTWRIAGFFRLLFTRPAWVTLVAAFLAVDVWILAQGDVLGRMESAVVDVARQPGLVLVLLGLTAVFTAFHECGHVTACRYGGARPGGIGVGLYIVWPAFYSHVTDSYRLDRVGRLRTDLGGVYFNTIAMLTLGLCYLGTGETWLLLALVSMHTQTVWQFLPNLRLDGYYILADLVGVPELFGFVKPAVVSLLPGRPPHPALRQLRQRARRVILLWVALVIPTLFLWLVAILVAVPRLLPAAWQASLEYLQRLDAAARRGDVLTTTLGVLQLLLLALPWVGLALILWSLTSVVVRRPVSLIADRTAVGWAWRIGATHRAVVRRIAVVVGVGTLGVLLVLRVAHVAWSHPAAAGELRLVDGAWAVLHGVEAPAAGSGDLLLRLQLVGYAGLTGAFERHDTLLAGGRELAVVASGALVAALLVFALTRRARPITVALPLLALLVMGPAVIVLATVGSGLVGTAWAAVGALVLASARRLGAAVPGILAIAVGVATEPMVAVPLALGIGVFLRRDSRPTGWSARHAVRPPRARPDTAYEAHRAWLAVLLVTPVAGLVATVPSGPADLPLVASERAVFLLLTALVAGVGLLLRDVRLPAAAAGSATLLVLLPWRGAGAALPLALVAVALLAVLMIAAWTSGPVQTRPHPLLRAAVVLPALVLVVTGALFLPSAGQTPPHEQLAGWISGPSSSGGTVAVPAGLWGDLLRDGVPPDRLVWVGSGSPAEADWAVTVGAPPAGTPAAATFGGGPAGLTVLPGAETEMPVSAPKDEP